MITTPPSLLEKRIQNKNQNQNLHHKIPGFDPVMMMDGHITPEYIDDNGLYNGNPEYMMPAGNPYNPRFSGEFEPYVRPDTQLGFIVDGQPVDEYGRPLGIYGHPPMGDYHLAYRNGNMEEDYAYGNYAYHR